MQDDNFHLVINFYRISRLEIVSNDESFAEMSPSFQTEIYAAVFHRRVCEQHDQDVKTCASAKKIRRGLFTLARIADVRSILGYTDGVGASVTSTNCAARVCQAKKQTRTGVTRQRCALPHTKSKPVSIQVLIRPQKSILRNLKAMLMCATEHKRSTVFKCSESECGVLW